MGASITLSSTTIEVDPGGNAHVTARVRNTATVVDQMSFEVIGAAKEWTTVAPATLSLFPGDEGTAEVTFSPPRLASVPAGPMPFALKAQPHEDHEGSAAEEGIVNIGVYYDLSAELIPRTSRGRRRGGHDLAVDNRSNVAYQAEVTGADRDLLLDITSKPAGVDIPAGTAGFAKVGVRPRRRFWRGPAQTRPFQVLLQPNAGLAGLGLESSTTEEDPGGRPRSPADGPAGSDAPAIPGPGPSLASPPPAPPTATRLSAEVPTSAPALTVDGSFVQEALLPKWLFKVIAAIVVLALIAAALWLALVKPQIKAAAKNQVTKQLAAAGITTTTSVPSGAAPTPPTTAAGSATSPTTGAGAGAGPGAGAGGGSQGSTATTVAPSSALTGVAVDGRLTASGNGTQTYVVPTGKTLQVTDVIFENPNGDTGSLVLARNGSVLLQTSLANFRDLDYHLVAPILFTSGQVLQMTISGCTDVCQPGMFYSGYLK